MHEVGHTLGLRHNFRASTVYTLAQLADRDVHARERHRRLGDGVQRRQHRAEGREAGRVPHVDARPVRLLGDRVRATRSCRRSRRRPSSRRSPRAAARPLLAFATDEDASIAASIPRRARFDLGADPLVYARAAAAARRRSCGSAGRTKPLKPGETYVVSAPRSSTRGLLAMSGSVDQRREVRRRRHVRCATTRAAARRR